MQFYSPYATSLDRRYESGAFTDTNNARPMNSESMFGISELGKTIIDGRDQGTFVQSVNRAIREGAGKLELQPAMEGESFGAGVENYSKEMRREIRELAKINKVELQSVHTPVQIGNISGFNEGEFSESFREHELNEIKKHIEFAGDVTNGGSVVVHTGEFPRPMSEAEWNKGKFEQFPGEKEQAIFYLVDERTGRIIKSVKKDEKAIQPVWTTDKEGHKVPVFENGIVKTEEVGWDHFVDYAKDHNKRVEETGEGKKITPQEAFYHAQQEANLKNSESWAMIYENQYKRGMEDVERNKLAMQQAEKEGKLTEEMKAEFNQRIKAEEDEARSRMEAATAYRMQAEELKRSTERVVPIDNFAKEKSIKSLKELGEYAMQVSEAKSTKRPIFIAPENIFPQMGYGSNPEELIELVTKARKAMAEDLAKKYGEERAKKLAEQHIKATLDTQHLGMWKRHFIRNPGESDSDFDKRFNNWYMDEVKNLQKKGVLGNIHIVDGFGRGHTHVVAGQGAMPVIDAVKWLKENGYKDNMISEAHGNMPVMMTGTWQAFGAATYGGRGGQMWTDVQNSYFGRNDPPMYVVGDYRPSDDWVFWSGVPLE